MRKRKKTKQNKTKNRYNAEGYVVVGDQLPGFQIFQAARGEHGRSQHCTTTFLMDRVILSPTQSPTHSRNQSSCDVFIQLPTHPLSHSFIKLFNPPSQSLST